MRGCLWAIVVFVVAAVLEWQVALGLGLPFPGFLAGALALTATLALGSVQGILQARRQQAKPQDAPDTWTDGALVRIEGTLVANGKPITAPFSQRPMVFLDYGATAPLMGDTGATRQRPHWRGLWAVDCALDVGGERIPLCGMPATRGWVQQQFRDEPFVSRAARHLAGTAWERQTEIIAFEPAAAIGAFAGSARTADGYAMRVMNTQAAEALGMAGDGVAGEAVLCERLRQRRWLFEERGVEPGARVTVIGTYHTAPRRLDIALSPAHADRALHLGGAASLAARQSRTTFVFAGVLIALSLAAHYLALADEGALYRSAIAAFERAR